MQPEQNSVSYERMARQGAGWDHMLRSAILAFAMVPSDREAQTLAIGGTNSYKNMTMGTGGTTDGKITLGFSRCI